MRLIDADALREDLIHNRSFYPVIVKHAIEDAPTIDAEPVKHGEWVMVYDGVFDCPDCGAKMTFKPFFTVR